MSLSPILKEINNSITMGSINSIYVLVVWGVLGEVRWLGVIFGILGVLGEVTGLQVTGSKK